VQTQQDCYQRQEQTNNSFLLSTECNPISKYQMKSDGDGE
jgi:hypothetical protein